MTATDLRVAMLPDAETASKLAQGLAQTVDRFPIMNPIFRLLAREGTKIRRPNWEPGVYVFYYPGDEHERESLMIHDREGKIFPWTPLMWDLFGEDYELA